MFFAHVRLAWKDIIKPFLNEGFLLIVLFVATGLLLLPPCLILIYLAGGADEVDYWFFFWPVAAAITLILLTIDTMRKDPWLLTYEYYHRSIWRQRRFWIPGLWTSLWLAFYFMPIIWNLAAMGFSAVGLQELADKTFQLRWMSRPISVAAGVTVVCTTILILKAQRWIKQRVYFEC